MGKMSELSQITDELRKYGEALIGISDTLADLFSNKDTEHPEAKLAEPNQKPLTLEQVRAVLADVSRKGHTAEIRSLLQKYGADKLSGIDPAKYKALLADVEVLTDAN